MDICTIKKNEKNRKKFWNIFFMRHLQASMNCTEPDEFAKSSVNNNGTKIIVNGQKSQLSSPKNKTSNKSAYGRALFKNPKYSGFDDTDTLTLNKTAANFKTTASKTVKQKSPAKKSLNTSLKQKSPVNRRKTSNTSLKQKSPVNQKKPSNTSLKQKSPVTRKKTTNTPLKEKVPVNRNVTKKIQSQDSTKINIDHKDNRLEFLLRQRYQAVVSHNVNSFKFWDHAVDKELYKLHEKNSWSKIKNMLMQIAKTIQHETI